MKRPEDVQLSREEGEALLARLEANTLTAEDRRVLGKVLTFYFLALVCPAGSEAESQAAQGVSVWGEAEEAQAARGRRDAKRRECRGEPSAAQRFTWRASSRFRVVAREETASAWTWAAGGRGVSGGADG
jgi:hypothetical protein